jgi:hypothetical protein
MAARVLFTVETFSVVTSASVTQMAARVLFIVEAFSVRVEIAVVLVTVRFAIAYP